MDAESDSISVLSIWSWEISPSTAVLRFAVSHKQYLKGVICLEDAVRAAISDAYTKYRARLMDHAEQWGFSQDVSEDLVQETFLAIVENPEKYLNCENRYAWLLAVLRNCMGHAKRSEQYAHRLQEKLEESYAETKDEEHELQMLYQGVISKEDLEILILYYVEERPYAEICARLGLKDLAVCRKRVQRAKERARKALGEDFLCKI